MQKFDIWWPATLVEDLNFDQQRWGVSDQLGFTEIGNPWSRVVRSVRQTDTD